MLGFIFNPIAGSVIDHSLLLQAGREPPHVTPLHVTGGHRAGFPEPPSAQTGWRAPKCRGWLIPQDLQLTAELSIWLLDKSGLKSCQCWRNHVLLH